MKHPDRALRKGPGLRRAAGNPKPPAPQAGSAPEKRTGTALDAPAKAANLLQLRRAKGQVDGVERMIQDNRPCTEIIIQITAARASLQAVAKDLLRRHLKSCNEAARINGGMAADEMYQELVNLVMKMAR